MFFQGLSPSPIVEGKEDHTKTKTEGETVEMKVGKYMEPTLCLSALPKFLVLTDFQALQL